MAKTEIICIILGVITTLLSVQMRVSDFFNAYYGYPFYYIHVNIIHYDDPITEIIWFGFVLDVVVWCSVFYVLILGLRILKKKSDLWIERT